MAKKKQFDPYYHRGEPGLWSKISKVLMVLAVIAVIFGGVWVAKYFQPKKVGWEEIGTPMGEVSAEVTALHDKSLDLERKFHLTEKMGEITPADIETLREALRLENEYLKEAHLTQRGSERLLALAVTLETAEAKPLSEQSAELKREAEKLEKALDLDGAGKLYGQAADLEERVLREYPHSKYSLAAPANITLWRRKVHYLQALPINDESVKAEKDAVDYFAKKDWPKAKENFQHAFDLQQRLNREFSETSFASSGRLQKLLEQVTALESLPDHLKIEKLIADAKAAEATETLEGYDKAAELFQEAERQQRTLANNFPKSLFATDTAFLVSIQDMYQTAKSHRLANEIIAQTTRLFDDLRQRNTARAAANIIPLQQKAKSFHDTFPHSKLIDDELQKRLDYLAYKSNDLVTIQEQVYGLLLPLPGQTRYLLDKQEVTQALYKLVAGSSPSRNAGPTLPVESVNWRETHELFCARLSWILARPVRLPTVDEFRLALGPVDKIDLAAMSWNGDNSAGKTQAVATKAANANGFYDLLGNVSEWLERPGNYDDDVAPSAGGSVQTPVDTIRSVPINSLGVSTGIALTGFRFVVDTDDSAPLLPKTTMVPGKAGGK